jgi:hypothetical protein
MEEEEGVENGEGVSGIGLARHDEASQRVD